MAPSPDGRATTSGSLRRYELAGEIARGGMGYVELVVVREGRFRRLYARKRLQPHFRQDLRFRSMFLDEARIAGLLCHPNVVSVLDVGEDEEGPYLIMDFVDGISAGKLVAQCAGAGIELPVQICVRIALEAARGLHAAHELHDEDGARLGLVHRDVSLQNILVSWSGTVQVSDFGIAKAYGNATRTGTGVLKGTHGYLSPEQLRFEEPDRRSDLFSLGVTLYELLSGERLYANRDGFDGSRRVLHEPPPDIGERREDVPTDLCELLFELLAKSPDDRPPSALDVARRLEAILSALVAEEGVMDLGAFMSAQIGDLRAAAQAEWNRRLAALPDHTKMEEIVTVDQRPTGARRRRRERGLVIGALGLALVATAALWSLAHRQAPPLAVAPVASAPPPAPAPPPATAPPLAPLAEAIDTKAGDRVPRADHAATPAQRGKPRRRIAGRYADPAPAARVVTPEKPVLLSNPF